MSLPVVNISVNTARRRHAILLNVSDLPSDDLSREIDRLWARVGSTSSESTLSSPSERERSILWRLLAGWTATEVAAELGLTVSRVSQLLRELGRRQDRSDG
jgi:DNA-binding NarL/FixJ family response regulator